MNGLLNSNIEPFLTELKCEDIKQQQYALKLEHNYKNGLTHDGKPKPRKVDIFKRTKTGYKGNKIRSFGLVYDYQQLT